MKRFPVAFILVPLAALAACASGQQTAVPAAGQLARAGTMTAVAVDQAVKAPKTVMIHVSCDDTGNGMGVRVHPWKALTDGATYLTWKVVGPKPAPPTRVEPVNPDRWPFELASYSAVDDSVRANLRSNPDTGTYRYRLRITCPSGTIVIDPDVVIRHTS